MCGLNIFRIMNSFPKLVQKVVTKRTFNMKVHHIVPLNYWLTGHLENFKINLRNIILTNTESSI